MATIPGWLTGKGVTAVTITPQTVNNQTGGLTDTTAVPLVGHLDGVAIRTRVTNEEISPMDAVRENYVPIQTGSSFELTEVLKAIGINLLAPAANASLYQKVVLTRGAQTYLFYGIVESYTETIVRGKSVAVLTVQMIDPGSFNPTYTAGSLLDAEAAAAEAAAAAEESVAAH